MKKRIVSLILAICLALGCLPLFTGCTDNPRNSSGGGTFVDDSEPKITNVTVTSQPKKLSYVEGEHFSADGLRFNAIMSVDGEDFDLEDMTLSDLDGTYTTAGELLTKDITKITFTVFGFNFDIDITVKESDVGELVVNHDGVVENALCDGVASFNLASVTLSYKKKDTGELVAVASSDFEIYDNGELVYERLWYKPKKTGDHVFTVKYRGKEYSFKGYYWEEKELTPTSLTISKKETVVRTGTAYDLYSLLNVGKYLKAVRDGKEITLGKRLSASEYSIKFDGTLLTEEQARAYVFESGTHTLSVVSGEIESGTISYKPAEFDKIVVVKKDEGSNTVLQKSLFSELYGVFFTCVSDDSVKQAVKTGDYKLLIKKNGSFVEVADDKAFEATGEYEFKVAAHNLETTFTVNVISGYEILCKDMIKTDDIKESDKNFLENVRLNGGEYVMKVSNDNGFEYAGEIRTGQILKFHVYSEIETEAELILYASSILRKKWVTTPKEDKWKPTIMGKQQFNTLFTASFEGTDISIADSVELPGFVSQKKDGQNLDDEGRAYDPACWTQWHPVNFGKIKLKKGDNVITMKTVNGGLSNVYKLGVMFVS